MHREGRSLNKKFGSMTPSIGEGAKHWKTFFLFKIRATDANEGVITRNLDCTLKPRGVKTLRVELKKKEVDSS